MKKYKYDMILVLVLLFITVVSYFALYMVNTDEPAYVLITIDSKEEMRLRLDEESEYAVISELGKNVIKINNGRVSVKEADCPDGLCSKQGYITRTGEAIVCLPHKVVVTICGNEQSEIDAVVN